MTLILGLDPSQSTGFALFDTAASLSAIRAGVLKAVGDDYEHKSATLGHGLMKLIKADRPDFIAIEMPIRSQPARQVRKVKFMGEHQVEEATGSGLNAIISSNQMVGACAAIIGAFNIPFECIAPVTWRSQFLGFGRRSGWQRKDWKRAVRERCTQLKISVTNDDMADAVGIAFAGKACQTLRMLEARAA
jgi:Holliday junction resolvasome RuvABC endonuclease subunit